MMESMGAQLKQKEGKLLQLLLSEQRKVKETMTRLTILADQVTHEKQLPPFI